MVGAKTDAEVFVVPTGKLPVILLRGGAEPLVSGDPVKVTGAIHTFSEKVFKKRYHAQFDRGAVSRWNGKPAVVASEVLLNPQLVETPPAE